MAAKFVLPTGYESEQRKAERKRKLAQMMLERGMQSGNMQSWTQPLAQMAAAFAGKRLDKKADKIDADVSERMTADFGKKVEAFNAATSGENVDPTAIVRAHGSDPMLQDMVKPYVETMTEGLKQRQRRVKFGDRYRTLGSISETEREPSDPNSAVIVDQQGNWVVNPVRTTAALAAQGLPLDMPGRPGVYSMPNPTVGGQAPPGGGSGDGMDLGLLTPEERNIMANELRRRAGPGPAQDAPPSNNIPMGSPLAPQPAQQPPAGVVNGKPYWLINGIPYDNPEGK